MHWEPDSEASIALAIEEGNLHENTHLDVKRTTGDSDSARRETAADLASFAIHGGALLIGVAEDKASGKFTLAPVALAGVAEKLEQIAANRVDPPLFLRVRDIPSGDDPTLGYVYVEIPPSPTAPHMVDGRYYARGDRTKRRLTDAEVVQMHANRDSEASRVQHALDAWVKRSIPMAERRKVGRLYIVGEPLLQASRTAFRDVSRASNNTPAWELIAAVENGLPRRLREFSPRMSAVHRWVRRSDGGAMTSMEAGVPGIPADSREESLLDVELRDNGGFRIVMGRFTATSERRGPHKVIFDIAAVGYAARAILLANQISERTGYRGAWGFGFHGDYLSDSRSLALEDDNNWFNDSGDPFADDEYTEVTTAHRSELEDAPWAAANRLVGRLLHSLGSYELFTDYLEPPMPPAE